MLDYRSVITQLLINLGEKMAGIYIHVPFCKHKCTYCDFASYPNQLNKAELYFGCMYKEMKSRSMELKNKTFDTIYFGGGTPSYVDPKLILGCLNLIKKHYNLAPNAEITLEVNPGTIDKNKLRIYRQGGINRFSVGLQSADDKMLKSLNRIHNLEQFNECAKMLKDFNFSVDVMIGLPDQDLENVKKTLLVATTCGAKHISIYALKPEEGTPMYSRYLNGDLPDGDTVADYYDFCVDYLSKKGFNRYEVSNFALDGYHSKHNLNYWKRGEYIGVGLSASSFIGGRRFTNTENIDEYIHCLLNDKFAEVFSEEIVGDEAKFEYCMLNLRTTFGINFAEYKHLFGSDFLQDFKDKLPPIKKYLDITDTSIKIQDKYLYVQNNIIIQLMD